MSKKILVANGSLDVRRLISDCLPANGSEIISLADGESAATFICDNIKDLKLVVVGFMLPRMNGADLAKYTKNLAREAGIQIPVLITTSVPRHKEALEEIGDCVLVEPFDHRQLKEAVESAIIKVRMAT